MDEPRERELVDTVLTLVAEIQSLRILTAFLLSDNPNAVSRLEYVTQNIDDLTLPTPLSEMQRDQLKESLEQVLAQVRADPYRWKLGAPS